MCQNELWNVMSFRISSFAPETVSISEYPMRRSNPGLLVTVTAPEMAAPDRNQMEFVFEVAPWCVSKQLVQCLNLLCAQDHAKTVRFVFILVCILESRDGIEVHFSNLLTQ